MEAEPEDEYEAAALERWVAHMKAHNDAIRGLARQNTEKAAAAMIAASIRSFKPLKPEMLQEGDHVRVSFLVLPSVRAVMKSAILGEPAPLWSPKVYTVTRVVEVDGWFMYDVRADEDGPNDVLIGSRRFSMPNEIQRADRRMLMYQPNAVRHDALGRRYPGFVDAAFTRAL